MTCSKNGKPNYVKSISRKSVKNSNGAIISESKGYEENNDSGLKRMAFQRRLNDKYHMRAKERKSRNEEWSEHQHLMNISDDQNEIKQFHDSFNRYSQSKKNHNRSLLR